MKSSDMVEALEINAAIDTMITDRQAIADRQKTTLMYYKKLGILCAWGISIKKLGRTGIAGRKLPQLGFGKHAISGRRDER
ncbi:Uncharacterised protein [Escherichia coli]|nr:Uncharacterised protein [Escherichia coli]